MSVPALSARNQDGLVDANAPASPLTPNKFAHLLARLAPFELSPKIAVAVSGGADSLALLLLAQDWAAAHGGSAIGLTVDHGLRAGSAAEARLVGRWLAEHGIEHHVLTWSGVKPATGIQTAARRARYDLLNAWCRDDGCLHLMLAHHQGDQAETVAMRMERGSGLYGLAGMPVISHAPYVRYLRPLLSVSHAELEATLRVRDQRWIEDPSNRNSAFARVRMRKYLVDAGGGSTSRQLSSLASAAGSLRSRLEYGVAAVLAEGTWFHPSGFVSINGALFAKHDRLIRQRVMARLVTVLGGRVYEPNEAKLAALCDRMAGENWPGATLGGCRIHQRDGTIVVLPETRKRPGDNLAAVAPADVTWRNLFRIRLSGRGETVLRRLSRSDWATLGQVDPVLKTKPIPAIQRGNLPVLETDGSISAVPHLGYKSEKWRSEMPDIDGIRLMPITPLCDARLYLAPGDS